jgi:prevent-host-death family protein
MGHMKSISIRELHERTGSWVRKAAELGSITVTERGKPLARLLAISEARPENPFRSRRIRPGYARLRGKLSRGTDSTTIVSEDRDRGADR